MTMPDDAPRAPAEPPLRAALRYAARGWWVFPCNPDKTPRVKWKEAATTDPVKIRGWWRRWPQALIGIYCQKSGFFVLDVDVKDGRNGVQTLAGLAEAHGQIAVGPVQLTPSGGYHLLFQLPADLAVPNNANQLGPGLDLRANGYICSGGEQYQWHPQAPGGAPIPPAPAWLLDMIAGLSTDAGLSTGAGLTTAAPATATPAPAAANPAAPAQAGAYWLAYYLRRAQVGTRNQLGFALACQLRDAGLSLAEAAPLLRAYAARVPGDGYTEREALASLDSAYRAPRREAAHLPGVTFEPPAAPSTQTPQPAPPSRYRLLTAADALHPWPGVAWVIAGLFSAGSVSVMYGAPGCKKTFAALSMAVCVAAGKPWLGRATRQGAVLIVDEESGAARLMRRLGDALRGELVADPQTPVYCVSLALFDFRKVTDIQELHRLILMTGATFVVVDALADVMPGGDENAVKDTLPVFLALRKLANETDAAILAIHHANKLGGLRGSTAIPAGADLALLVTSDSRSPNIDFQTTKARDTEPQRLAAVAHFEDGQYWLSGSAAPANEARVSGPQLLVLGYLREHGPVSTAVISLAAKGYSARSIKDAVYELARVGLIARTNPSDNKRVAAVYDLTPEGRKAVES